MNTETLFTVIVRDDNHSWVYGVYDSEELAIQEAENAEDEFGYTAHVELI